jgi:hypothetical protein
MCGGCNTNTNTNNDDNNKTIDKTNNRRVCNLHQDRMRLRRLAHAMKQLAAFGPTRPPKERGLAASQIADLRKGKSTAAAASSDAKEAKGGMSANVAVASGAAVGEDPMGMRIGVAPDAKLAATLVRIADESLACIAPSLVARRKATTRAALDDAFQLCDGAVKMAYPMKLPEHDFVRINLANAEDLSGTQDSKEYRDAKTSSLWFAGKQMLREHAMGRHSKNNEKVTLKVKLHTQGAGPPPAEPAVDAETRKQMMAHWHKKQKEQKKLETDDESQYLNSAWANPKAYKQAITGMGNIKFKR